MFSLINKIGSWFYTNDNSRKYGWQAHIEPTDPKIKFTDDHVKLFLRQNKICQDLDSFDLRKIYGNVKDFEILSEIDQGYLASCCANSIAFAYAFNEIKQNVVLTPSRLFIYYNARLIENKTNLDTGIFIKSGLDAITKYGVVDEQEYIYDQYKFATAPSTVIYEAATKSRPIKYAYIDLTLDTSINDRVRHLQNALTCGYPIIFGFNVYESFEDESVKKTGVLPMPKPNEKILGGHSVCAVGYNDDMRCFIVKNSYGPTWGDKGYFYMPYDYIGNAEMASDFWIMASVTDQLNID